MASDKRNNHVVHKSLIPSLHIHAVPITRRSPMIFFLRDFYFIQHGVSLHMSVTSLKISLDPSWPYMTSTYEKKLIFPDFSQQ